MASVVKLYDDNGAIRGYRVRYRTGAGRALSRTFPKGRKAAADAFAVSVEADKLAGAELDDRGARMSVADYCSEWRSVRAGVEGTGERVDTALRLFLEMVGERQIRKVRPSDIKSWIAARGAEVAGSTLTTDYAAVRAVFRAAVADGLIRRSPCDGLRLETPAGHVSVIPDAEGVEAIAAGLPRGWAFLPVLMARTGLRPGEAIGLCVDQVDFLRRTITVDRQCVAGRVKLEPKTAASRRVVPVDDETIALLAAHLAAHPVGAPVEVWARPAVRGGLEVAGEASLIFHRRDGGPICHRSASETFRRHAAAAGWPGCRMHDMRHFYASELLAAGVELQKVSRNLGHSRPSVTADIYLHDTAGSDDRTRDAVGRVFAARHGRVTASRSAATPDA